ncbi:MarR family winged helix-turn-helix transcriptional regulator [Nakamurella leprariae]|uniref:MarR family transcriptional regulator n=1 Tax=Nakamurella leprariae TaxID=2803911 RepID=A0A938YAP3_9ACTN|nr:MarR family transcriptional regulator [Nakamurella leprariae]MBM9466153.1 MarR family transcriptional regulator [Nakamurella leprariae]
MTDAQTPWLTPEQLRAWRNLQYLRGPLAAVLNRQLTQDSGLSTADYEVLVVLSESDEGMLRAGELGRLTGWEKSRLSHHIKRMQTRGLVRRRECPTDGRGAFVELTPQGRETIEAAAPGHVRAVRRHVIDRLTPEELRVLGDIGEKVAAGLESECTAACQEMDADEVTDRRVPVPTAG